MVKADLVQAVMAAAGVSRNVAATAAEQIFDGMAEALARGERIELRGFGVFQVRPRKRGVGRNPKTGVEVAIPPGQTVRFKGGKGLRGL